MRHRETTCRGALVALIALGACATAPPPDRPGSEQPARARYMPYVGAPIERFTWMMPIDGFETLSDSELIIFMGANTAYYLKVWAPCGTKGLRYAHGVGLSSSIGGTVTAGLDSLQTQGMNCPISEIRPFDYKRMKAEARAAGAGQPPAQR